VPLDRWLCRETRVLTLIGKREFPHRPTIDSRKPSACGQLLLPLVEATGIIIPVGGLIRICNYTILHGPGHPARPTLPHREIRMLPCGSGKINCANVLTVVTVSSRRQKKSLLTTDLSRTASNVINEPAIDRRP